MHASLGAVCGFYGKLKIKIFIKEQVLGTRRSFGKVMTSRTRLKVLALSVAKYSTAED